MRSNQWELEEAQRSLRNFTETQDRTYLQQLSRYLEKALECVQCMYCHGHLGRTYDTKTGELEDKPFRAYYKGFVHEECAKKYSGRGDYKSKNGD